MDHLVQEVEVGGKTYIVQAVDAQTQYKILQKLARFGVGPLIAGMVKAGDDTAAVKRAYLHALVTVVQGMPEADQDFCLTEAVKKTAHQGQTERGDHSSSSGHITADSSHGVRARWWK